jgi:hypothetical protein
MIVVLTNVQSKLVGLKNSGGDAGDAGGGGGGGTGGGGCTWR